MINETTKKVAASAGKVIPGTNQVKINPIVTMLMTILTYVVTTHTQFNPPPEVWVAVAGLISYGWQYWYGPRSD